MYDLLVYNSRVQHQTQHAQSNVKFILNLLDYKYLHLGSLFGKGTRKNRCHCKSLSICIWSPFEILKKSRRIGVRETREPTSG